ncbi:putative serine/threonine-protein kinase ATM [Plasmopara halstedii]
MVARSERDAEWLKFSTLCNELRSVKNSKGVSAAVEKVQTYLSDNRSRQLVHRWRSWGYLLNCLLHVLKEEMRTYLSLNAGGHKRKIRPRIPQLRYWHYLRAELETAHVAADGPMLHLDPNGRDCIYQLFIFAVTVIDRQTTVDSDPNFETLVDKEAWLTVEILVQYRVYCAILDDKDWKNMLQLALGSISHKFDEKLIGDVNTAATRARVINYLIRNCPFDLKGDLLLGIVDEIESWFEAATSESMEREGDNLLLVIASTMLETLTDLTRMSFGSIGPYLLKRGRTILEFIVASNKARRNGLRGAPAEFLMLFFELYQHNVCPESELCYLTPVSLLREMKKLIHVALGPDEINTLMTHFNSAREQRLGNALGIDDQGIRHLACTADIIFYHDYLVTDLLTTSDSLMQDDDMCDPLIVGKKRLRSTSTVLAWETVIEQLFDSSRVVTQHLSMSSSSSASQRQTSTLSYLTRGSSMSQRTDAKQNNDAGSWLLLLLSILTRHGDYYVLNRIGDLMLVMQKLTDILTAKEMGKLQTLTLQVLIQLAALSARHRNVYLRDLNEYWATIWHTLLRTELPYIRITEGVGLARGQAGDTVLTLLNCCISFGLISESMIEAKSMELWNLPAFRQPSADTPVSRGDPMMADARTSIASMCTLLCLLRHVQVPPNIPTAGLQGTTSSLLGENLSEEHDMKLLQSLFDHLRDQVLWRKAAMEGNPTNSYTKGDWQTAISPLVYASVIQVLLRSKKFLTDTRDTIFAPELIRKLSANHVKQCESVANGEELNGFGIAFCMLETGLDHLSMAFPDTTGVRPHAHSLLLQAFLGRNSENNDLSWYNGIKLCAIKADDQFERLAVPPTLMNKLIPSQHTFHLSHDCFCKDQISQSIAIGRLARLQKNISYWFSHLLSEISSTLPSDGCNQTKGLRMLANLFDVGLVLAALYASEDSESAKNYQENNNRLRVLPLLKHFFTIVADHLKPSLIRQAQQSQSMSKSVLRTLRRLHTLIIILQGRDTIKKCCHPSAYPIELRFPPDLRLSIRAIVSTLEESLEILSGGAEMSHDTTIPVVSRQQTGFRSRGGTSGRPSSSQNTGQPIQKDWDVMDEGEDNDILRDHPPSNVLRKSIGLWCFRLILLLKKDSGLPSVKKHVVAIKFDPDFVLAVAVLLCGVVGPDSQEAFVTLIDYAADEGMRENGTMSTSRKGGPRAAIFLSQVLSALFLAGLMHEKRHNQHSERHNQHSERPPGILVDCAKRHLKSMANCRMKQSLRVARMAELQCLEVYFRLHSHEFIAFEEACICGLTDCDTSVRFVAARGLQTIYYMYPQGGEGIFQHFFSAQKSSLDELKSRQVAVTNKDEYLNDGDNFRFSRQKMVDTRLCVDMCLSVLLSLYVSACSTQTALVEVLIACVQIATVKTSLYCAGTPSLISRLLQAIAEFYAYANVSSLLDDHFCALWHHFIAASNRPLLIESEDRIEWIFNSPSAPLPNGKALIQQFPLSTLLGEDLSKSARRSHFMEKMDIIVSIGVFHCFISKDNNGNRGSQFEFVDELLSYFLQGYQLSEQQSDKVMSNCGVQLTTDLLAFSLILSAHRNPKLNQVAHQMTEVVKERVPLEHLEHAVVSKMTKFVIWDIVRIHDDQLVTQSDQWWNALKSFKENNPNFDWKLVNMAEMLCEFHVLLLRAQSFDPRAEYAVNCFNNFVLETRVAVANDAILQRLLLLICFQSIKNLAVRNRPRIGGILCRLVRDSCELYMKSADLFGKNLSFVVQEISEILFQCNVTSQRVLHLKVDDQAELEKVIFAVCNDLARGLGKYAIEIDLVPDGIATSLDKLNATLISHRVNLSELCQMEKESVGNIVLNTDDLAKLQLGEFIKKERSRGVRFYSPLVFCVTPCINSTKLLSRNQNQTSSFPDVRFSAVRTSIGLVRDTTGLTKKLFGELAFSLLHLSSSETFGRYDGNRDLCASLSNVLGELGALDACEYELSPSEQEAGLSCLYQRHFRRGSLCEVKTNYLQVMYESVLATLSSLFFEGAKHKSIYPSVLEKTLKTVKDVLSVDEGVTALARSKDKELKTFLEQFQCSPHSTWSSATLPDGEKCDFEFNLTYREFLELWTSVGELNFDTWICSLTSCLARVSSDPILKACSQLCAMRADMAIFLFPYALDNILRTTGDQKKIELIKAADVSEKNATLWMSKAASEGIRLILLELANFGMTSVGNSHSISGVSRRLQAVQLIIHGINFLRETEKARFVDSNGKCHHVSTNKGKGTKRLFSDASSSKMKPPENNLAYGYLVDVDPFIVAKAAVLVQMPYSAMQYVEMWLEMNLGGRIKSLSSLDNEEMVNKLRGILVKAYSFDSDSDGIYGVNDGRTMKSQLVKYDREGEYAKALPLYDVSLQFLTHQQQINEETMKTDSSLLFEGILASLHSLGYNHLLEGYLQSLQRLDLVKDHGSTSAHTLEHMYKRAWVSMQWDAALPRLSEPVISWNDQSCEKATPARFSQQQTIYESLRSIAHRDFPHLQHVMTNAKTNILRSIQLSLLSFESTKESFSALAHLQAIREIEELANLIQDSCPTQKESNSLTQATLGLSSQLNAFVDPQKEELTAMPLHERWQRRRGRIRGDFITTESLLALEEILIQVSEPSDGDQVTARLFLDLAALSRKAGRIAVAYRALYRLDQLHQRGSLSTFETVSWRIQKAKLLWTQQEPRSAIWSGKKLSSELTMHIQKQSLSATDTAALKLLHVKVLTMTGRWISCQRSESSQVVLEDFFQKATSIISSMDANALSSRPIDAAKAHFSLASFMSAMYQQVSSRVNSREWLAGKKVVQARHDELRELQTMEQSMQNENRAHIHTLNREVVYDMNERSKVEASVDQFLIGALYSYGKGLSLSPEAELDTVFRVLSLWLNNQRKADINRVFIEELIDLVPSYKFVPLSYQIISRISSSSDVGTFQIALRKLVMKLSLQHPHHTLVQLIALKNSGDVEGKGALQFRTNVGDAKAEGAKIYLTELLKTEQRELLENLDNITNAYIQLALFDTSEYHNQKKKIPLSKVPIFETNSGRSGTTSFDQCLRTHARRGESVVMPAVLTSNIEPQGDMDYSNIARMYSFEPQFSITDSGIHRPKIIFCYGSDGKRYKQLVKGHDDTRQDLVIEQVFDTMNQFLTKEKTTRNRRLRLRTYRVIPLSPIAGVLEWVENTVPWGSYLVGRTPKNLSAHERYHPHEWKHNECRQHLKNAPDKLAAFLEIEKNFTPVFHHFFLEKFPDASVWYRRRLAYVQSAAVTSIIGYILGIGDRHSQNILVHEETGELVHIDFGVVFDQGMALFTPETVPFRLTRDMVDGMGISGVDGVYSRCCEVTLQLLRKKSASVVTILEVFVHDPLYRWTLSPLKALRIQGEQNTKSMHTRSSGKFDGVDSMENTQAHAEPGSLDAAARALIRVKQKLEGYEDPNGSALSIEGQVKQLISIAQDPQNLCKLFPGWAPWL